jgi:hypothetical protein
MLYLDTLPIASLCMPALLAVYQETCRGDDVSALNFTVHGSPSYSGIPVVLFSVKRVVLINNTHWLTLLKTPFGY